MSKNRLTRGELARALLKAILQLGLAAVLCYNNILFGIFLLPWIPLTIRSEKKRIRKKKETQIRAQFLDAITCISVALEAGYSAENAVSEAVRDLTGIYREGATIIMELNKVKTYLASGISLEDSFEALAESLDIDEARNFADIFSISKRTGGNIISIIRSTAAGIRMSAELKMEHEEAIAAQRYESNIMRIVPVGMLIYLRLFSGSLLTPLYGNLFGIVFMTVMLVVYILLWKLTDRIINGKEEK